MKNKLLSTLILALFTVGSIQAQTPLTSDEKSFVGDYLKKTSNDIQSTVKGLSEEQLTFKPDADSWSVDECMRHIAITEAAIWNMFVEGPMATTPDPSKRGDVVMTDEQVMAGTTSRAQKVKTFAPMEPQNMTESYKAVMKEFKSLRSAHMKWVKKTDEDLRNRYAETPFGIMDTYQAILFLSAHSARHAEQMREVMASANFPSK
jgi:DinB superfamily